MYVRSFADNLKKNVWGGVLVAVLFAASVFAQCALFQYLAFGELAFETYAWYLPKFSIVVGMAAFSLLFRRKYWVIVASILINVWILSELFVFRANNVFLDSFSFLYIGNMSGFWSSVPVYFRAVDIWFWLITAALGAVVVAADNRSRSIPGFISAMVIAVAFNFWGGYRLNEQGVLPFINYNFFSSAPGDQWNRSDPHLLRSYSVVHVFFSDVVGLVEYKLSRKELELSPGDLAFLETRVNPDAAECEPSSPLILILIESLEGWVVNECTMPNLHRFATGHDHVLFAPRVERQVRFGTSADGQMIVLTGILPISEGTAAYEYPLNYYPALPKMYGSSVGIFPHPLSVWNQLHMSDAYGLGENIVTSDDDVEIISTVIEQARLRDMVFAITVSTHTPFADVSALSSLELPDDMPQLMRDYMRGMNVVDSALGLLLDLVDNDGRFAGSTVAIGGDHSIFGGDVCTIFNEYLAASGADYSIEPFMTPFIIYSPSLDGNHLVDNHCFQMDIYPTLLASLGCEHPFWKGFGVNMLDKKAVAARGENYCQDSDYWYGDRMIKSDYFRKYYAKEN